RAGQEGGARRQERAGGIAGGQGGDLSRGEEGVRRCDRGGGRRREEAGRDPEGEGRRGGCDEERQDRARRGVEGRARRRQGGQEGHGRATSARHGAGGADDGRERDGWRRQHVGEGS